MKLNDIVNLNCITHTNSNYSRGFVQQTETDRLHLAPSLLKLLYELVGPQGPIYK